MTEKAGGDSGGDGLLEKKGDGRGEERKVWEWRETKFPLGGGDVPWEHRFSQRKEKRGTPS